MININFNLDKKDGKPTLIIATIRYHGKRIRISMASMGVPKIEPKNWNSTRQKAKGTGAADINHYLDKFIRVGKEVFHRMNLESGIPEPSLLKQNIRAEYSGVETNKKESFMGFVVKFIEESAANKAKGTTRTYKTAYTAFLNFQKSSKRTYDFKDMDLQFCLDFERYLLNTGKSPNYSHKIIRIIKTMLKDAHSRGVNKYTFFEKKDFRAKKTPPKESVVLSLEEMDRIMLLELDGKLDHIRDMFLIGCHTGLRISDYRKLLEENIYREDGKEFAKIRTEKTLEDVIIPINPSVKLILGKRNGELPRIYSDQQFNKSLKIIGEMAGLDERVTRTEHKGSSRFVKTYHKYELISSHTARRSFATNAVLQGVPYHWIMQVTGHRSVKSFEKYVKISAKQAAVLLADHSFFNRPVLRAV